MTSRSQLSKGSLALDWYASTSRNIDDLDAAERQAIDKAKQQREQAEAKDTTSSSTSSDFLLPANIVEAKVIPSHDQLLATVKDLKQSRAKLSSSSSSSSSGTSSPTSYTAQQARLTYAVYSLVLSNLFEEASLLQDSTWYWSNVSDSRWSTTLYLIQTFPARLVLLGRESYRVLHQLGQTATSSSGPPPKVNRETVSATIRQLRKTPDVVLGALWPHSISNDEERTTLRRETVTVSSMGKPTADGRVGGKALAGPLVLLQKAKRLSPLSLTQHETQAKLKLLRKRRNQVAEQLGELTLTALSLPRPGHDDGVIRSAQAAEEEIRTLLAKLREVLPSSSQASGTSLSTEDALLSLLEGCPTLQAPALENAPLGLARPSELSLLWPRLILYPTLMFLAIRSASQNREVLAETLQNAKETARGFVSNWIVQPVMELLDTIRGGNAADSTGIVTKEGLTADLDSLERMVTSYALDKGQISAGDAARAEELRRRVREGDLDVVMRAYEDQLKSPLKSLTVGSLPRLLLIQIQKAKYDLAVAMQGIDHLLKSQALLFGAVGIAPAMGIVYLLLRGGTWVIRGKEKKDDGREKERAWSSMRRVDRLLTGGDEDSLSAKSYGLLLLELASLRRVAADLIPTSTHHQKQKKGRFSSSSSRRSSATENRLSAFLEDVRDLEGIAVSLDEDRKETKGNRRRRKETVERIWRCWGNTLFTVGI